MTTWLQSLEDAADPSELLGAARDYLTHWEPRELALIPEAARPSRVKGIDDFAYWHQRLVECYCGGAATGEGSEKVRDMLQFFSFALQRVAELEEEPPVDQHDAAVRLFSERSVPKLFTSAMTGAGER